MELAGIVVGIFLVTVLLSIVFLGAGVLVYRYNRRFTSDYITVLLSIVFLGAGVLAHR